MMTAEEASVQNRIQILSPTKTRRAIDRFVNNMGALISVTTAK